MGAEWAARSATLVRTAWSYDLGCRAYMVLKCAVEGLGTVLPTSVQQSNTSPCGMATSSDALAMEFGGLNNLRISVSFSIKHDSAVLGVIVTRSY